MIRRAKTGYLLLEDGRMWEGWLYGVESEALGEVVFNTAQTGYQEVTTDPSYWGQIVVMTQPHIGNTGVNPDDYEAHRPNLAGFIARSFEIPSNWRSTQSLKDYLIKFGIPALEGIDTRAVTQHLRIVGALRGGVFPLSLSSEEALQRVLGHPSMEGLDGAREVCCRKPYDWTLGSPVEWRGLTEAIVSEGEEEGLEDGPGATGDLFSPGRRLSGDRSRFRVAVWDYGVKRNILRRLVDVGAEVRVYPAFSPAEELLESRPDGILLSNGPGDPAAVVGAISEIRKVAGRIPIFGICLGHQLLALATGGRTYKMKFGHRGINHPCAPDATGRVLVTVHNHGFAVDGERLPKGAVVTLRSLNDNTIEGLDYPELNAFSVQFHPEASPGPHDASDLFLEFRRRMGG